MSALTARTRRRVLAGLALLGGVVFTANGCFDFDRIVDAVLPSFGEGGGGFGGAFGGGCSFDCGDGSCIPFTFACDGVPDCENASDEQGCQRGDGCDPNVGCSQAITDGKGAQLCGGPSADLFDALETCVCVGTCAPACGDELCAGVEASSYCIACIEAPAGCAREFAECTSDT